MRLSVQGVGAIVVFTYVAATDDPGALRSSNGGRPDGRESMNSDAVR